MLPQPSGNNLRGMPDKLQGVQSTATTAERRASPRLRVSSLIYVELGNGNGGIVTSISGTGVGLAVADVLRESAQGNEALEMRIQLPGFASEIAANGQIVWRSKSGKEAGLRFVGLEEKTREDIENWISGKTSKKVPKVEQQVEQQVEEQVERRELPKMKLPIASATKTRGPRFSFADVASSRVGAQEETFESIFSEAIPETIPEAEAVPSQMKSKVFVDGKKAVAAAFENPVFTEAQKEPVPAQRKESQTQSAEEIRQSRPSSSIAERRSAARRPILLFTYAVLDEDNGGLAFNLGEGGLALTAAATLRGRRFSKVRVRFPDSEDWIEAEGRFAWISDSGKEAGIEFVSLREDTRARIKEWVSQGEPAPDFRWEENEVQTNQPPPTEPPSFVEDVEEEVPSPQSRKFAASFDNCGKVFVPARSALFLSGIKGLLARAALRRRVAKIEPPQRRARVIKPQGQVRRGVLACTGVAALFAIGWLLLQRNYRNAAGPVVAQDIPSPAIPTEPTGKPAVVAASPASEPLIAPQTQNATAQNVAPQEELTPREEPTKDATKASSQNLDKIGRAHV